MVSMEIEKNNEIDMPKARTITSQCFLRVLNIARASPLKDDRGLGRLALQRVAIRCIAAHDFASPTVADLRMAAMAAA